MPAPVQHLPPKAPVQKAIPPQSKQSEKPDDFKQALEDATKKPADQTPAPEPKPADAKPEAKKTSGKSANKVGGKTKTRAGATSGRSKQSRGKGATEAADESGDIQEQDVDLELASAIVAAETQNAPQSNVELRADARAVPAPREHDDDADSAAHHADPDLPLADAAATAQAVQPVQRSKDQPPRDSQSQEEPDAEGTPKKCAVAAAIAKSVPVKPNPQTPSAPPTPPTGDVQAVETTDDSTPTDPVNQRPVKASALPKTVAQRKAASDPDESSSPAPTETTAKSLPIKPTPTAPEIADGDVQAPASKQSPQRPAATADQVSDLDLQAAPLAKPKASAATANPSKSTPDADPTAAVDAASAFAQLTDPDVISSEHSKETNADDLSLDPTSRLVLDAGPSHAGQPAATESVKSPETTFHVPQSPEDQFADANHDKIVTAVRGELLPHGGSMQIRLDPPELGALKIMVEMRDGVMNATFQTSNEQATQLLGHSLNQLKHVLESQGMSVERLQVEQAPRNEHSGRNSEDGQRQQDQQRWSDEHTARQEQQRKEMLRRMWRRVSGAGDPIDFLA